VDKPEKNRNFNLKHNSASFHKLTTSNSKSQSHIGPGTYEVETTKETMDSETAFNSNVKRDSSSWLKKSSSGVKVGPGSYHNKTVNKNKQIMTEIQQYQRVNIPFSTTSSARDSDLRKDKKEETPGPGSYIDVNEHTSQTICKMLPRI
jgi:hypothetical protein